MEGANVMRGEFKGKINRIARSQVHVRLVPYIHYLAINNGRIDPTKINQKEREIISEWRAEEYLTGGASEPIAVSEEFWDMMNEVLWASYVQQIPEDLNDQGTQLYGYRTK